MSDLSNATSSPKCGLLAAGNFIIDHVKIIDYYPQEEMLATISTQSSSNGGGPYNVLKNLAKLGAEFPLAASGLIGTDDGARWIYEDCKRHGIDHSRLAQTSDKATSYTDAFTVSGTGKRTFFHQPGANASLLPYHIPLEGSNAKVFYLGYLMLLDALDSLDGEGRTGASKVLERALEQGCITVADLVSKNHIDFAASTKASLPFVDYLVLNEIESGRLVEQNLRPGGKLDRAATVAAGRKLLEFGVRQWVVIHAVEGAFAVHRSGEFYEQTSLQLPDGFSQGATGAGDAFASGVVYGIHEGWSMSEILRLAACVAASCLQHPSTSEGILPVAECLALAEKFGYRDWL